MKKVIISLVALIVIAPIGWFGYRSYQNNQWLPQTIKELGVHFEYPNQAKVKDISDQDTKDRIVFRLGNGSNDPLYLITFRYEDGLRATAALTHQDLISMLLNNAAKAFPSRYPEYDQISARQFEVNAHQVAEVIFTYKGTNGERVKVRFLILDLDGNQVLFVAAQAKEADFTTLNKKYFNRLLGSFSFET